MGEQDAAGLTLTEVQALSLEEQYALYGERYERSGELLTEAQLQVSDGTWDWILNGVGPSPGVTSHHALRGAEFENSYYIGAGRAIHLPGAIGDQTDTQPMLDYYDAQGWESELLDYGDGTLVARAFTDDGYRVDYMVRENGQRSVNVASGTYWGEQRSLLRRIMDRVPDSDLHESSPPGVLTPFPDWDAPVVRS